MENKVSTFKIGDEVQFIPSFNVLLGKNLGINMPKPILAKILDVDFDDVNHSRRIYCIRFYVPNKGEYYRLWATEDEILSIIKQDTKEEEFQIIDPIVLSLTRKLKTCFTEKEKDVNQNKGEPRI